jgi:hypothetical protein
MAKTKISEFSTTPGNNTDINGINIAEGCAPSGINNAIRELMSDLKEWQSGAMDVYVIPQGTAAAPGIQLYGDLDTGLYGFAANQLGVAVGGASAGYFSSAGWVGNVNGTITGDINATTIDTTNLEVTNIKAKDGTAAITIADSTGVVSVSTQLAVDNLNLSGNTLSSSDTNGNIILAPNGTGDVYLDADTIRVGDSNTNVTITSNGTADLILNTNSGTNSGSITIQDGVNGNILIATNGTGQIQLTGDLDVANIETGAIKARDGTASATIANSTGVMTIASSVLTTTDINGGTIDNTVIGGATTAAGSFTTVTATQLDVDNLRFDANTISSTNTNGNIQIAPAGTGDVYLDADTVRIGDLNSDATLTTNGTADLILNTNSGSLSGSITIQDGVNGNILISPNGTGQVQLSGALDVTNIEVTNIKAKDGTAALSIADSTGAVTVATALTANGGAVFNENGADVDFRVESDTDTHALFVDASENNVGVRTTIYSGFGSLQVETDSTAIKTNQDWSYATPAGNAHYMAIPTSTSSTQSDWLILRGTYYGSSLTHKTGIVLQDFYRDNNQYGGMYIQAAGSSLDIGSITNGTYVTSNASLNQRVSITSGGQVNIGGNFTSTNNTLQVTGNAAIGYTTAAPTTGLIVAGNVGVGTDAVNTGAWGAAYPKIAIGTGTSTGLLQLQSTAANADGKFMGGVSALNLASGVTSTEAANILFYQEGTSATAPGSNIRLFTRTNGGSLSERARITSVGGFETRPAATGHAVFNEDGVDADFRVEGDTDANLIFADASTDRVGIGTNAPGVKLDIANASTFTGLRLIRTNNSSQLTLTIQSSTAIIESTGTGSNTLAFSTEGLEKARITSGGDFRVKGAGTAGSTDAFQISGSAPADAARITSGGKFLVGQTALNINANNIAEFQGSCGIGLRSVGGAAFSGLQVWNDAASGDNLLVEFLTDAGGAVRGTIDYNRAGGQVRYNTTSDYRAKEVYGTVQDSGAQIDALKIYRGKMLGATQERPMMIAHEAQEIVPYAVGGEKDAVNEDGTPKYQTMDHQILVPLLIAELQSLRARVAQLEGK